MVQVGTNVIIAVVYLKVFSIIFNVHLLLKARKYMEATLLFMYLFFLIEGLQYRLWPIGARVFALFIFIVIHSKLYYFIKWIYFSEHTAYRKTLVVFNYVSISYSLISGKGHIQTCFNYNFENSFSIVLPIKSLILSLKNWVALMMEWCRA